MTEQGPPGQYIPGQVVNGHVLALDGQWHRIAPPPAPEPATGSAPPPVAPAPAGVRYDPHERVFRGDLPSVVRLGLRAVQSLGWTVTDANERLGLLVFETGITWGSWSGVTGSLGFAEVPPDGWRAGGTGKQNIRGGQVLAFDFGEADGKVDRVIEEMIRLAGTG